MRVHRHDLIRRRDTRFDDRAVGLRAPIGPSLLELDEDVAGLRLDLDAV